MKLDNNYHGTLLKKTNNVVMKNATEPTADQINGNTPTEGGQDNGRENKTERN